MVLNVKGKKIDYYLIRRDFIYRLIDLIGFNLPIKIDSKETIFISGVPRSGSTWVMELLETLPNYKTLFEPFHIDFFPEIKELDMTPNKYLDPHKTYPKIDDYLKRIISGKKNSKKPHIHNSWIASRMLADKLIIKSVRTNRMLPHISKNFQLKQIYLLIRHPCAVINSQIEKWGTGYYLKFNQPLPRDFIIKEVLTIPDIKNNEKLVKKIKNINSSTELLALIWAVNYLIPLSYKKKINWHIISYEKLLLESKDELEKIFKKIGEDIPEKALKRINKPSGTTSNNYKKDINTQLSKWKIQLKDKQIKTILDIISWFGLDFYTEDISPDYEYLQNWPSEKL